ncbi:MAG: O-methyltransferase [Clostridia bacterium]|nr:O-methyltransferase [Clostridia bacterium]
MDGFTYAHADTGRPEKPSVTAAFNKIEIPEEIRKLQEECRKREIPVADDETLGFLLTEIFASDAKNILEIGTAAGISDILILTLKKDARITTMEINPGFMSEAKANFAAFGVEDRVTALEGDAGKIMKELSGPYDFVFLDGPKVQYVKYLEDVKRLLLTGGVIFADDVLFNGYVTGEVETPPKRRSIVGHIKKYIEAVTGDSGLYTTIVNIGDGVALSVKK